MDDDQRWAEAEAMLRGDIDEGLGEAVRRRRRTVILTMILVVVALVAVEGVVAVVTFVVLHPGGHPHPHRESAPAWAQILGFVVILAGILLMILAFVGLVRSGLWGSRWNAPTSRLTSAQRKGLRRQVLGQETLDPAHVGMAQNVAQRMLSQRWLLALFGSMVLNQVGAALGADRGEDIWHWAFTAVVVVFLGVAAVLMNRDVARARRFLNQHPVPA